MRLAVRNVSSLRTKRSNPSLRGSSLDCFVAEPVIGPRFARIRSLLAMTVGSLTFESENGTAALARAARALGHGERSNQKGRPAATLRFFQPR
jgi:hypothetical protein